MRNKAQKSSSAISRMLQQLQPCYYTFHSHQDFIILCQSPYESEISKILADFMETSIRYFLRHIIPNLTSFQISSQSFHKQRIANLIISCRQQIQQTNIQGACCFALCYLCEGKLCCFRTDGIQMFIVCEESAKIWEINHSQNYSQKRSKAKNKQQTYFSASMPKIKAEYIYEQSDILKKQVYFQMVDLCKYKQSKNDLKLLLGCSQTFDLLNPELIFKYFHNNIKRSDCEKANQILQQAKKKSRSVHQQDLSLSCWRILQANPEHQTQE